jgi:hypothetical protein
MMFSLLLVMFWIGSVDITHGQNASSSTRDSCTPPTGLQSRFVYTDTRTDPDRKSWITNLTVS